MKQTVFLAAGGTGGHVFPPLPLLNSSASRDYALC